MLFDIGQLPFPFKGSEVTMASVGELLKAPTKRELVMLTTAWTKRYTDGPWMIQLGYSPDRVKRTEEGYQIYMEAKT
jgi:hypothetical protein